MARQRRLLAAFATPAPTDPATQRPRDRDLAISARFASGAVGSFHFTGRTAPGAEPVRTIRVFGSAGWLRFDPFTGVFEWADGTTVNRRTAPASSPGFIETIAHFVACCRDGRASRTSFAEQAKTIRATDAVNIGCGRPPAGLSPADEAWEPFWSLLEEARVPVLLHIGGEYRFVDKAWGDTPNLRPGRTDEPLDGETVGPYSLAVTPFGPQAFLAALILDGVLERHPGLRIGVIEMTAQWVGPFAEMLDQKLTVFKRLSKVLSLKPSEYFSRQIRVTPFWWEPVGTYIDRYGLDDVYVFSTDFPHVEGGTDPFPRFWGSLDGHADTVFEKFFVENARLIL